MPKMKTNRAAAKRFKLSSKGGIKRRRANRNHILTKKAPKRKRQLRLMPAVKKSDVKAVKALLRQE